MKRNFIRTVAWILALTLLLPVTGIASFAEEADYVSEDFEDFSAGKALEKADGFTAVPSYNEVRVDGENGYLHVPFKGTCETYSSYTGNVDNSLIVSNTRIEAENGNFVLEASYRPHWVDVSETRGYDAATTDDPTVQCQFLSVSADTAPAGSSLNFKGLYIINLRTGHLSIMGTHTGAAGLIADQWNTVRLVIDPQNGLYDTYVNGVLYATDGYFGGDSNVDQGLRGIDVPEGKIIIAKCNKNVGAYVKDEDAEEYSYMDVDNVRAYPTEEKLVVRPMCDEDFEGYQSGKVLSKTDGFAGTPVYNEVKSETENKYLHIPFLGKCVASTGAAAENAGNADAFLRMNHPAIPYTKGIFTVEVSYRPHYEDVSALVDYTDTHADPTVQCQFLTVSAEENPNSAGTMFKAMYKLNLRTGALLDVGEYTGAAGLVADEWNTVKMVIDADNAIFETYVNGDLYATGGRFGSDDNVDSGMRKLTLAENSLIIAKCNKNVGAYVDDEDATRYSYVDVDNVAVKLLEEVEVTLNGEVHHVYDLSRISLATEGKQFLYASVTRANGESYITYEDFVLAEEGMQVESFSIDFSAHSATLRTGEKTGLRFVSKIGRADYEALKNDENVESIKLGTLIVPALWRGMSPQSLLPENFKGCKMLDFPMEVDAWYTGAVLGGYHLMAASVVDIREENYNYQFTGIGYMKITMKDGRELVLTTVDPKKLSSVSIAEAAAELLSLGVLSPDAAAIAAPYAEAYVADPTEQMKKDLEGLNVLAMGDSTFAGDELGWKYQWINWLASDLGWNLTNLADGGMSISYREGQTQGSIVHRLFTEEEYKYGGSTVENSSLPWRYSTPGALGKSADEVDLILLTAGFNDYGGAGLYAKVGEMSLDNRDTETFIGAWNVVLDEVLSTYVNAKIVIINQWHLDTAYASEARGDEITCYEFTNSIKDLYETFYYDNDRIHLLDSGDPDISGCYMMDYDFRVLYSRKPSDVFHLNKDGMAIMKNAVLPYLWNYVTHDVKAD